MENLINTTDKVLARHEQTRRTVPDWEREIAWSQLGWIQNEACRKKLRRQRAEKVLQGICIVMGLSIIAIVVLVALRP